MNLKNLECLISPLLHRPDFNNEELKEFLKQKGCIMEKDESEL